VIRPSFVVQSLRVRVRATEEAWKAYALEIVSWAYGENSQWHNRVGSFREGEHRNQ
jgi:nuclear transport factor 2 (NTF2) superfamily protein